jgi:hypothetical protein
MPEETASDYRTDTHAVRSITNVDPLIVAAAASAVGALAASFIPRTGIERQWLGQAGSKINAAATAIAMSAGRSIRAELATLPLTSEAAGAQVERVLDCIVHAE